jgi:hypothetical protein
VAASKDVVFNDYAKTIRLDKTKCGPQGKWFKEIPTKEPTPVDELFDSFDI